MNTLRLINIYPRRKQQSSMDCSEPSSSRAGSSEPQSMEFSDEIQWRFSQIKGNIETDDAPTDGFLLFF